ncbi:hypothetical protein HN587_05245 [Candidatus Woesearchaeota archaeon]|jgi:NMD protein affecting ribosome stability and mRNA decay|nr:hypothetical protein [Candidatus Woesearchaeota archaeon]
MKFSGLKSRRFCPKCGKDLPSDEKSKKATFCKGCALDNLDVTFKEVAIKVCVECKKFMYRGIWSAYDELDKAIVKSALLKIVNPQNLEISLLPNIGDIQYNKPGLRQEIELDATVSYEGLEVEFVIPAFLDFTYCAHCSKKGTQYFEGVLQLREVTDEIVNFVKEDVASSEYKGAFANKESLVKNGVDFYLTSNKYLREIGEKLKRKFGGELKTSKKLFSHNHQTSRDIYRMCIMFRPRTFSLGDVVEVNGKQVQIKSLGLRPHGIELKNGKKVFVK